VAGPTPTSVGGEADALLGGRWRLGPVLGRGGMADVHRGTDGESGAPVAIKVLRVPEPTLARRLAQEAQALRRVTHPGLVRFLDAGTTPDGRPYLVMELVEGQSLAQRLAEGPLNTIEVARLGTRIAGALAAVHAQGVVHRDVKPGNLLVARDGQVKLADFGIASLADASALTVTGTTLGTAAYMAPEQLEHHQVSPAADIWALGIVLLEALLGRRLYQGSPAEVVAQRLAGPVPIPSTLPSPWRSLLAAMLDHDPTRRPSAAECAELLASAPFRLPPAEPGGPPTAPMVPTAAEARLGPPEAHDLAALRAEDPTQLAVAPAPVAPAPIEPAPVEPAPVEPAPVEPLASEPDPGVFAATEPAATVALPTAEAGPATQVGSSALLAPSSEAVRRRRRRALAGAALGAGVLATVVGLLLAGSDHPGTTRTARHRVTHQPASTAPSSSAPSSTTTGHLPSPEAAATALLAAVAGDVSDGGLSKDQAAKIGRDVSAALIDAADGSATSALSDLDGVDQIIATAADQGNLSAAQAASLDQDLVTLAEALGLPAPSAQDQTDQSTSSPLPSGTTQPAPAPAPAGPGGGGPGGGGPPGHQPGH